MAHREQQVQGSGKRRPTLGLVPTMDSPTCGRPII